MAQVQITKFQLIKTGWAVYQQLSDWWKKSKVDGLIDVDEFSNLWLIFASIYEDLSGKKISVKVPTVKKLKSVNGKMRKNISIKEVEVEDEINL